jgi:segregation and condensation protein A
MIDRAQPQVVVEGFTGPFDLLVRLIERRELDLLAISLARVADQYLEHLTAQDIRDPEHLSAFLVVAAKLLVLKSRLLLPRPPPVEGRAAADDPTDLTARLATYRQFREAADALAERDAAGLRSYPRPPVPYATPAPRPPDRLDPEILRQALFTIARRPREEPPTRVEPEVRLTVKEAIELLRRALAAGREFRLTEIVGTPASSQRLVAAFLATLELARLGQLRVEQPQPFAEITLQPVGEPEVPQQ